MSNIATLMLNPAAMMDNLAEKVNECPLNSGCLRTSGSPRSVCCTK